MTNFRCFLLSLLILILQDWVNSEKKCSPIQYNAHGKCMNTTKAQKVPGLTLCKRNLKYPPREEVNYIYCHGGYCTSGHSECTYISGGGGQVRACECKSGAKDTRSESAKKNCYFYESAFLSANCECSSSETHYPALCPVSDGKDLCYCFRYQ